MSDYFPMLWHMTQDHYGDPIGHYSTVTNLSINRAPLNSINGQVQVEQNLLDRYLYMYNQVPVDRREGLDHHRLVLIDNDKIQNGTRAFTGQNPIIYEPGIVLGHKKSDNRIRYALLSDPTVDNLHAALTHVATCLIEYRRKDYHPQVGEEVRFVGGFGEANTYRGQMFGRIMQHLVAKKNGVDVPKYHIHWRDGRSSAHFGDEFRTIERKVVYVCMRGAWD